MEATSDITDRIITLNVGGILHTTTLSTLTSKPSMLQAMFSGNYTPTKLVDKDGNPFIDRNGRIFKVILEYLRTGEIIYTVLPKRAVDIEFEWFGFDLTGIAGAKPKSTKKTALLLHDDRYVKEWEASPAYDHYIAIFEKNFNTGSPEEQPNLDKTIYDAESPYERSYYFDIPGKYLEYLSDKLKGMYKKNFTLWMKNKYDLAWCDVKMKTGTDDYKKWSSTRGLTRLVIDVKYKTSERESPKE